MNFNDIEAQLDRILDKQKQVLKQTETKSNIHLNGKPLYTVIIGGVVCEPKIDEEGTIYYRREDIESDSKDNETITAVIKDITMNERK